LRKKKKWHAREKIGMLREDDSAPSKKKQEK